MAPTVPAGVPSSLIAGDTWQWTVAPSTFPIAEGWTLSYEFRISTPPVAGRQSALAIKGTTGSATMTNDGTTWTALVTATITAGLAKGRWDWRLYAAGSGAYAGQRYEADAGTVEVRPDLASMADEDNVADEELLLAAIDARVAGRLETDMESYGVAGRQVMRIPFNQLLRVRGQIAARVYAKRHGRSSRTIEGVFVRP